MRPLPNFRAGDIPGGVGSAIYGPPTPQPQDGSSLIRNALLNVLTLGEHQNPGSNAAYWGGVAHGMDPRTPSGAVNLASILVPGAGRGRMTMPQREFLRAITETSYRPLNTISRSVPTYEATDPSVQAFARLVGQPANLPSADGGGWRAAQNPLGHLIVSSGRGPLRLSSGRERLGLGPGNGLQKEQGLSQIIHGVGDTAGHENWLNFLMRKNAIQRRN